MVLLSVSIGKTYLGAATHINPTGQGIFFLPRGPGRPAKTVLWKPQICRQSSRRARTPAEMPGPTRTRTRKISIRSNTRSGM